MPTPLQPLPKPRLRFAAPLLDIAVRRAAHARRERWFAAFEQRLCSWRLPAAPMRISALLAAVVLAAAAPARADTSQVVVLSETITFSRAHLSTDAGARKLLHRIDTSARRLCSSERSALMRARWAEARACRFRAVAQAVAAVNAPRVTAAHSGRAAIIANR